jgi:methyl-accepting chemotaxis protein
MFGFSGTRSRREHQILAALDRSLATIEFKPDGTVLSANENFCRTMGYRLDEIVGKHHSLFVDDDYARSPDYQAFWRKLREGAFELGSYKRRRKDGAPIFLQATYNPILDDDGRVDAILKVAADVTATKMHTLETDAKIAAVSNAQAVIEFTPNGEIIEANENLLSTMGYHRGEIIGRHHSLFVDPAYAASEVYREFWRRLGAGESFIDNFRRVGKGGKPVLLQASYHPVRDLDGKVYKIVKFASDITDILNIGEALSQLSRGDLSRRLVKPFAPAFDQLRVDFNSAADNLSATLQGVVASVTSVNDGAEEIAKASSDLSQRTEAQAASLEQTAAALEEVTQTVAKTAQSAKLANKAVSEAKAEAQKGGDVVGRAVEAMNRLERSSQEISAIIGVIDEIAFQTNLLALNAGVEAARAGDAGRGFAVVASEVRALAQRSAEAAKRIKTLIAGSGADVGAGVALVRETGEALGVIVDRVAGITALVGGIANGAEEQSGALGQVNVAVSRMDQSTQQNAAMAEQANAAVQSMMQQIDALKEAIGAFRLADADAAGRRPARRAA